MTVVGRTDNTPSVEQEFCVLHATDIGGRSVRTPKAGSKLKFGVGALGLSLLDYRDLTVREVVYPFRVDGFLQSQDLRRAGTFIASNNHYVSTNMMLVTSCIVCFA